MFVLDKRFLLWSARRYQITGEELFFESIAMACNALAIIKNTFYYYAKNGRLLKDKYKVEIFDIRKTLGPLQ